MLPSLLSAFEVGEFLIPGGDNASSLHELKLSLPEPTLKLAGLLLGQFQRLLGSSHPPLHHIHPQGLILQASLGYLFQGLFFIGLLLCLLQLTLHHMGQLGSLNQQKNKMGLFKLDW